MDAAIEDEGADGERAREAAQRHLAAHARWEYDTPGIQLGVSYRGSPLVVDDGSPAVPDSPVEYVPNAAPGSRLPHVWLSDGTPLYDALGFEFTLIGLGPRGAERAWLDAAAQRGIPLAVLDLASSRELRGLVQADWIYVRPDRKSLGAATPPIPAPSSTPSPPAPPPASQNPPSRKGASP